MECVTSRWPRPGKFKSAYSLTRMRPSFASVMLPSGIFQSTHSLTECDTAWQSRLVTSEYFNPRIPSQECDNNHNSTPPMPFYFNPRTPSQNATEGGLWKNEAIAFQSTHSLTECDSKNYQIFFYSLQFLIPIVPLLSRKLNHYIFTAPYFPINFQFSSANPSAFSCPLRIRTMCLLRFSAHCLQSPIARF